MFKPNSSNLSDSEKNKLDKIVKILDNYKKNNILIIGHTANLGKPKYLQDLSEKRAKSVLDYFVKKHNFNRELLSFEGKADREPVADNKAVEGQNKNRSVEILIIP